LLSSLMVRSFAVLDRLRGRIRLMTTVIADCGDDSKLR
jgi:hypothetical protein